MKITFIGAAHQVTGSCTFVEWMEGRYFLVDCGLEQGENCYEMEELPVSANHIEYVFLTHAHIDHSGRLPLLYRQGFRGKIYSTPETQNLCSIMLADSAIIQENDAEYQTKKNLRMGLPEVLPEYTREDAAAVMTHFRPCEYNRLIEIDENLSVRFSDAGHLLGSSFIEFFLRDKHGEKILVCSGDVGNLNQPIIQDPHPVRKADYLLIESTYGTRNHEKTMEPIPFLVSILRKTFDRGGTVIIPSFAVGRTQELLYFIREIKQKQLLPEYPGFPVYVDSPLAEEATGIFLQCSIDCLDDEAREVMLSGENPIWSENLNTVISAEESKQLNANTESKVIIASGGMCEGGRIRHHLKHNLWNDKNTILFTGYQAVGTLGRMIYDGAKTVKILGEAIEVHAEIALLEGISGHADQKGLLAWLDQFEKKPSYVFVNHGDDDSCNGLSEKITELYKIEAKAPFSGSQFDLSKGEWIKLTSPIYKKKENKKSAEKAEKKKSQDQFYKELTKSMQELKEAIGRAKSFSNAEMKQISAEIQQILKDHFINPV